MNKGCNKEFEKWYYDEDGVPSHSELFLCGFAFDYCDKCKKHISSQIVQKKHAQNKNTHAKGEK